MYINLLISDRIGISLIDYTPSRQNLMWDVSISESAYKFYVLFLSFINYVLGILFKTARHELYFLSNDLCLGLN